MGNVWHIVIRFEFNLNSYFIMEDFIIEVQKVFPNIDRCILEDYFDWGWAASEFILRETELQNEYAEMEEQYKQWRKQWI